MLEFPLPSNPAERIPLRLEGTVYLFEYHWNTTDESWMVSIYNTDEEPLVVGVRMVLDQDLLRSFQTFSVPPGRLFVVDTSSMAPLGREAFDGDRDIRIVYLEKDEVW